MDAPKCRLCGKKHYGLCEIALDPETAVEIRSKVVSEKVDEVLGVCPTCGTNLASQKARQEYMKNYMQRWRKNRD